VYLYFLFRILSSLLIISLPFTVNREIFITLKIFNGSTILSIRQCVWFRFYIRGRPRPCNCQS